MDVHCVFLTRLTRNPAPQPSQWRGVGSFCVASAMFLILELSQPYSSAIRVSSDGIDRVGLELTNPDRNRNFRTYTGFAWARRDGF